MDSSEDQIINIEEVIERVKQRRSIRALQRVDEGHQTVSISLFIPGSNGYALLLRGLSIEVLEDFLVDALHDEDYESGELILNELKKRKSNDK